MAMMRTAPGSHGAPGSGEPDRGGRGSLRAAWWSFALLPFSFVGASVLGGVVLAATGHDPDSELDPSFWQTVVAGLPSLAVMVLPCVLVVWFGRRALGAGLEGGREAMKAGLVVGSALVAMNLLQVVARLVTAVF